MKSHRHAAILVTHSTEIFGPPFALLNYLKRHDWEVLVIDHPLDYASHRRSKVTLWHGSHLVREVYYHNWLPVRVVNYLKDITLTFWALIRFGTTRRYDLYIGCDSLATIPGLWLRHLLRYSKIIGYNTDYSTTRFNSALLNGIYSWADRYVTAHVDTVWCVTKRIAEVRRKQRPVQSDVLVVPNGVYLGSVKATGSHDKGLVFTGNLTPEKGIDLLLRALAKTKQITLTIFGDGGELRVLQAQVAALGLNDRVIFAGQTDNATILAKLPDYQAGVALYQGQRSYVHFSDPLKVKEYLAAGLPVIITNVPEIAQQIADHQAGVVIGRPEQLGEAIDQITKHSGAMGAKARQLAKQYDWDTIFSKALAATIKD